jgi:hypothetical protein
MSDIIQHGRQLLEASKETALVCLPPDYLAILLDIAEAARTLHNAPGLNLQDIRAVTKAASRLTKTP